jgi:AcrR family transcriptional regulator
MASLPDSLSAGPVGRQHLPREVMDEHQRERIIDAAIGIFAKRGYQGTTIDHLVAASRIGVGSFYSLFDGKEDCFLHSYDRIVSASSEQIAASSPASASWPEQTCAVLAGLLREVAARPLSAHLVFVEAQTAGSVALGRYETTLQSAIDALRSGRARAPLASELPPTFEEATVCGLSWLLQQRIVMGELDGIDSLLPELAQLLVAPFYGSQQATHALAAVQSALAATA